MGDSVGAFTTSIIRTLLVHECHPPTVSDCSYGYGKSDFQKFGWKLA
jgi:hypothetical protein